MSSSIRYLLILALLLAVSGCVSLYSKEEEAMYSAVAQFGKVEAQKYGMRLFYTNRVSKDRDEPYSMAFSSSRRMGLEEGKRVAKSIVREFYDALQTMPAVQAHLESCRQRNSIVDYTPKIETVCIKITFWDEQVNRIMPPYLAEILFVDSVFYYYQADPATQKLVLVAEEPYQSD